MFPDFVVNGLMVVMVLGSLFLAVVSYLPKFPKLVTPTWSTQYFSTIIVVIASKLITLYVVLTWVLTAQAGTQHTFFIWGFFLCMLFGIYVYFNFGSSERERANTGRILENKPLAILISIGILLFYSFCTMTSYSYWTAQPEKTIFLDICLIAAVDFFFFSLLWLRYWLTRDTVTQLAIEFQKQNPN